MKKILISERGCKCERCGRLVLESKKLIGHHKIELTEENVHDPMISLNPDLIELVCFDCHEDEKKRKGGARFDEDGYVISPPD